VLRGAGIAVSSIELVHVNTAYVRGPDGIRWTDFFARMDVGNAVAERLVDLPANLPGMRDCLAMTNFRCGTRKPMRDTLRVRVPRPLHGEQARRLDQLSTVPEPSPSECAQVLGIEAISAIPADFPLTWKQAIVRDTTASGQPYVSPDLARLLGGYGPPAAIWISKR